MGKEVLSNICNGDHNGKLLQVTCSYFLPISSDDCRIIDKVSKTMRNDFFTHYFLSTTHSMSFIFQFSPSLENILTSNLKRLKKSFENIVYVEIGNVA